MMDGRKGNWVRYDSRRFWIEGREWRWDEEEEIWRECESGEN